jgi:hypothetical protein
MAEHHLKGMEAAIARLEDVCEELESHVKEHKNVVTREIEKVKRKKLKIVKKVEKN